jgi:hypothetical protein
MLIRDAVPGDWPAIWAFMHRIAAAGETFSWDLDITEENARGYWLRGWPTRAVVAVDDDRTVLGTAGYRAMVFNAVVECNTPAVRLWQSPGFQILATVPEGFLHPVHGYVGLHVMYRRL